MPDFGTHLEITGTASTQTVKVNGQMLPCTTAALSLDARALPVLTVELPIVDGLVVSLEHAKLSFGPQTRAALVAAGWTPPEGSSE